MFWAACVTSSSSAASAKKSFDLAAGAADAALKQLSIQAGVEVIYSSKLTRNVTTNRVRGNFTAKEAMDLLLAGTGLVGAEDERSGSLTVRKETPEEAKSASRTAQASPGASSPDSLKKNETETPPQPMKRNKLLARLTATAALILGPASTAQVAPDTPGTAAPPAEPPVELSPFTVTSDQDVGYQAANTLAGSRMSTSLKDTAASISILTEEFLKDIGALTLDDAIAFGNNVELADNQLSNDNATFEFFTLFRIRGQAATVARNYFAWKLPTNTFNIERIEEARGPNSILFGIASAGGLISTSTKQAYTNRNFRKAQLVYGRYDLRRATVDLNRNSFNGKLGVRFNAVVSNTQGYRHYVFDEDNRAHLAVKYNLTLNTVVRGEYEIGRTRSNKAHNSEINDRVMRWINAGRPLQDVPATNNALGITRQGTGDNLAVNIVETGDGLAVYDTRGMGITQAAGSALITDPTLVDNVNFRSNVGGPGQTQDSRFDTYSASIDHKLGKSTFLQLAYNHQNYDFDAWQATD